MTDITELAQSLKAAAENAIGAHERLAAYPYDEIIDISQHEGEQIDIDITDLNEFNKEANPENILALVEALEKAQRRIVELDRKNCELDSLTQRWVVERAENADHIAELESRTVKLPLCVDDLHGIGMVMSADAVVDALTSYGIKVEAE
ncbi:ead/Ea22-like family protein [Klebsiella pneumoniae]|uniref:ead/Ea22-like family protein n=1 Tax=Klebsiella pneumoniae TaxID=573 RepID=UPI003B87684A|nr:allophanate hydrolase subunit 1 [Klebsiella pneumoniae]